MSALAIYPAGIYLFKVVVKTTGQRRSGVIVIIIISEKKLKLSFGVSIVVFGQVND